MHAAASSIAVLCVIIRETRCGPFGAAEDALAGDTQLPMTLLLLQAPHNQLFESSILSLPCNSSGMDSQFSATLVCKSGCKYGIHAGLSRSKGYCQQYPREHLLEIILKNRVALSLLAVILMHRRSQHGPICRVKHHYTQQQRC